MISSLYEDKIAGIITQETFSELVKNYEKQKQELNNEIVEVERKQRNVNDIEASNKEFENTMKKILEFEEINEENKSLVFKLIDKIIIGENIININYKFDIAI